jgi:hypothetical protein
MVNTTNITDPIQSRRPSRKLSPKYIGPYEVEQIISTTAYKLKLPPTLKIHPVLHVSMLKPYKDDFKEFNRETSPQPEITSENQQEDEYEVESILDKKIVHRKIFYLVKWKGYPMHDATWEPKENLKNAANLVNDYENQ